MTYAVNRVNTVTDTWQVIIDRINTLANLASNAMLTVDVTANGSSSTGNAFVNGIFGATTLVTPTLRGGTVQLPAVLTLGSNVAIGNVSVTNTFVYAPQVNVGSNVSVSNAGLFVGNSTANATVTGQGITVNGANAITTATRSAVAQNATSTYQRSRVNYVPGNNVTIGVTDEPGNNQVTVTIAAQVPSLSLGGAAGQVQYNSNGQLAASAGLSFAPGANNLTVANTVYIATLVIDGAGLIDQINLTANGSAPVLVDTWSAGTYRQAEYQMSVTNLSANGYMGTKLMLMHDGSDSHLLEYGAMNTNSAFGTWSANVNSGAVNLYFTPQSVNTSLRMFRHMLIV